MTSRIIQRKSKKVQIRDKLSIISFGWSRIGNGGHDTIIASTMKTSYVFGITLVFLTLVFVFVSANVNPPAASARNLSAASLHTQLATPTQNGGGHSEIGSTDGIVIMGFVLTAIATLPLLFRRKRKKQK
jgi:hypothetical protein